MKQGTRKERNSAGCESRSLQALQRSETTEVDRDPCWRTHRSQQAMYLQAWCLRDLL